MMLRMPSTDRRQLEIGVRRRVWLAHKARQVQVAAAVATVRLDRWDLLVLPAKMASKGLKAHPAHRAFRALQASLEALDPQASKGQLVRPDSTVKTARMERMGCQGHRVLSARKVLRATQVLQVQQAAKEHRGRRDHQE